VLSHPSEVTDAGGTLPDFGPESGAAAFYPIWEPAPPLLGDVQMEETVFQISNYGNTLPGVYYAIFLFIASVISNTSFS
jgi:hypothetical protein